MNEGPVEVSPIPTVHEMRVAVAKAAQAAQEKRAYAKEKAEGAKRADAILPEFGEFMRHAAHEKGTWTLADFASCGSIRENQHRQGWSARAPSIAQIETWKADPSDAARQNLRVTAIQGGFLARLEVQLVACGYCVDVMPDSPRLIVRLPEES